MQEPAFVHLQCQSEYSIKNSLIRVPKLIDAVKQKGMNAVALTDDINLFSAVKFYQKALEKGVKPLFGAKMSITSAAGKYDVLLLCQNHQGYLNLSELISTGYLNKQDIDGPSITEDQLESYHQGLLLIANPVSSDVAQLLLKKETKLAREKASKWQEFFGDRYYFAVQRTSRLNDEQHLHLALDLGVELGIPIVATNDVQFLSKSDFEAHEARICISQGGLLDDARRVKHFNESQYLKSADEMAELFADFPQLLTNTVEVVKRCNLHFELFNKNYLPIFPTPKGISIADFFEQESKKGLKERLKNKKVDEKIYAKRLQFEISVILNMNFPGYFLIVSDFIRWAKENDIPVGPGRGSGAGSLVAWALSITNVDPIEHELIFERFLNPERVSMPDFDIDFCTDRRDEVIGYVASKYGQEKVSQIITYGTMAAKAVVRDVGRVLGHPYGFSDAIAKLIPNELKITLDKALQDSPELQSRYISEESVTTLIDLSKDLEGLVRNAGTHAGGVVIAPSTISNFCPIYKGPGDDDVVVSQFDKDDVEAVGLVKFDFLGLSNLTVIDKTVKLVFAKGLTDELIDVNNLSLDDPAVYELLQCCDTTGVFQLESDGMRGYLKKLQADSFEDIVAILALYRPGPLDAGMVDNYIDVKHGRTARYPHPMLEEILKPTNGVFLYQEQVMKSAQLMAGYSLGKADLLRQAMGKKKVKDMAKQRKVFVKGAAKKDIKEEKANEIFDLIDKFSGYGFNKSHSVAYAYISYQTAWLKAHYPAPFMASLLSGVMDETDRIAFIVSEAKKINLIIQEPNINQSEYQFSILNNNTITYGLGAIKGLGESLVQAIVLERDKNGDYKDIFDFCLRSEKKFLNRRAIEALIYSGAFDSLGVDRATLIATYPNATRQAEQIQKDKSNGQAGLFEVVDNHIDYEKKYVLADNLPFIKMLMLEKSVMGYYLNQHPTDFFKPDLKSISCKLPQNIIYRKDRSVRILALISEIRYRDTKKGQIASIILEDGARNCNAILFTKALSENSEQLQVDKIVVVVGKINKDFRDQWQVVVDKIEDANHVQMEYAKYLLISMSASQRDKFQKLYELLRDNNGQCPVIIEYKTDDACGKLPLKPEYSVRLNPNLIESLERLVGQSCYRVQY